LDEKGGPWSVSEIHGDPDPNVQHPVVIIDRQSKKVTYTGLYYYLAHFSKFVRPGAIRIQTVGSLDGVRVMAFKAPDGGIVTELMNSKSEDVEMGLKFHDRVLHLKLPAISITTALWNSKSASQNALDRSGKEQERADKRDRQINQVVTQNDTDARQFHGDK